MAPVDWRGTSMQPPADPLHKQDVAVALAIADQRRDGGWLAVTEGRVVGHAPPPAAPAARPAKPGTPPYRWSSQCGHAARRRKRMPRAELRLVRPHLHNLYVLVLAQNGSREYDSAIWTRVRSHQPNGPGISVEIGPAFRDIASLGWGHDERPESTCTRAPPASSPG